MGDKTAISWADATFNPWIGCTRISPACDGCYAAGQFGMHSFRGPPRAEWGGPGKGEGTRSRTADSTWATVRTWNRQAGKSGKPTFVFCASLADVADTAVPFEWFLDLLRLAKECSHLTFLFLTKRIGNLAKLARKALAALGWDRWPKNIAAGATVINQEEADRDVPKLLAFKAEFDPAFVFLSMEPLLGPVDLTRIRTDDEDAMIDALRGEGWTSRYQDEADPTERVDWVITGGETDQMTEEGMHRARPADPEWFRSLRDQCAAAGVPFHFKQWGEWQPALMHPRELVAGKPAANLDAPAGDKLARVGKAHDPCTLDGVRHGARPEVPVG